MNIEAELLFEITEEITGITREEILSKKRKPDIVDAKKMMALSFFKNTKFTFEKIGEILGGLDHSSISYYVKNHDSLMETDVDFMTNFSNINSKFKIYQDGGIPNEIKLRFALEERKKINKKISKLKKLLKFKSENN
jgi:hypothetical protein